MDPLNNLFSHSEKNPIILITYHPDRDSLESISALGYRIAKLFGIGQMVHPKFSTVKWLQDNKIGAVVLLPVGANDNLSSIRFQVDAILETGSGLVRLTKSRFSSVNYSGIMSY